jgi:hypothetical protein
MCLLCPRAWRYDHGPTNIPYDSLTLAGALPVAMRVLLFVCSQLVLPSCLSANLHTLQLSAAPEFTQLEAAAELTRLEDAPTARASQ